MSIREKKNKDGTISFYITVFEGYKNRSTRSICSKS